MSLSQDYTHLLREFHALIGLSYTEAEDGVHALAIGSEQLLCIGLDADNAQVVLQDDIGPAPIAVLAQLLQSNHAALSVGGTIASLSPTERCALTRRLPLQGLTAQELENQVDELLQCAKAWLLTFSQATAIQPSAPADTGDAAVAVHFAAGLRV